jgi:hypothetical protein
MIAIDIAAASSVLKMEIDAIVKEIATMETTKAFKPALAEFDSNNSSLFCRDKAHKPKKLMKPKKPKLSVKRPNKPKKPSNPKYLKLFFIIPPVILN